MKNTILKRLLCGLAVAAMVLTTMPVVNSATSVTAEAKKKKEAKTKISYLGGPFDKSMGVYPGKTSMNGYNMIVFSNMKAKAKYTFTTNSKNLSIKMDTKEVKKVYRSEWTRNNDYITYLINAKKTGTYKVTIKEKYKGVTRTLKKNVKLCVIEPKVFDTATAYIGNPLDITKLIDGYIGYGEFYFSVDEGEDTVVSVIENEIGNNELKPIAEGTAKINIKDGNGHTYGITTLTVKTNHCTSITMSNDACYYDDDGNEIKGIELSKHADPDDNYPQDLSYYLELRGTADDDEDWGGEYLAISDEVKITSADPSIVSVSYESDDSEDGDNKSWYAKAQKAGDTTITVTCGDQFLTIPVHVKEYSEDEEDF